MSSPAPAPTSVRVRVPATSANLGPGFDTLGLALGLSDVLTVTLTEGGLTVTPYGTVPVDERNLVVRALRRAFEATGGQPAGLSVTYTANIPHSRGLGSSSAAICAGVLAALSLRGRSTDDDLALQLAAEIEGHPDNVAPCLLGGLTVAWYEQGLARAARLEPADGIEPVVFVPAVRTSTERSRSALPTTVAHPDAAFSGGRAALLVAAMTTRTDLLLPATEDRLHQQYRLPDVPVSAELFAALRAAGIPAVLSGSGPSVLALCRDEDEVTAALGCAEGVSGLAVHRPGIDRGGARVLVDQA